MHYFSLSMILSASLLILVLALLRRVLRGRVSLRLQYGLWLLVALRLLVPVELGSLDFSVSSVADTARLEQRITAATLPLGPAMTTQPSPSTIPNTEAPASPTVTAPPAESSPMLPTEGEPQAEQAIPLTGLLFWVWLAGALALLLWQAYVNLGFSRWLRQRARPVAVAGSPLPVYLATGLRSPCLFGVARPRIYLNRPPAPEQLPHILRHELCHWRHGDQWWAFVRALCLCLH